MPTPVSAVNNFYFEDFTADYYLSKAEDGTSRLKVVEQLTAIFPHSDQNHGITRVIPYTNQDGQNLTMASDRDLPITVLHNGQLEQPYKIDTGNGFFTVYIGSPSEYVHGKQIYQLEYEFQNVITSPADNPNHQELYWDTNGNDWAQQFENLTARVHFASQDITNAFDGETSCYVGKYGAKGSELCSITELSDGVEFHTTALGSGENLTFNLEFDQNTFKLPEKIYDYRVLVAAITEVVVIIILFIITLVITQQTKVKRKYYKGLFITPEYAPPHNFTVAEMATNYLNQHQLGSSKVATLMELAISHKIELARGKSQWTVKIIQNDFTAEQSYMLKLLAGGDVELTEGREIFIRTHVATSELRRLDKNYCDAIEKRLQSTNLSEPEAKTLREKRSYSKNPIQFFIIYFVACMSLGLPFIITSLSTGLSAYAIVFLGGCGLLFTLTISIVRKSNPCNILRICSLVWLMTATISALFMIGDSIPSYITLYGGRILIISVIVIAVLIVFFAQAITKHYKKFYTHTTEGLKWSRYLDGLRLYIKMAEQDRIRFLQSVEGADTSDQGIAKLYEKLLPYAIIFRLEKSWLREMNKYYALEDVSKPNWYVGEALFSVNDLSRAMHLIDITSSDNDTSSSHSRFSNSSSSSSGSSGGGFSGGGGGGGGGGGW